MGKLVNKTLRIAAMSAGEEIGHVSGPIVTFRGNGDPLRSLLVGIDPVQDLHGYDSPWPAGGNKNKIPYPYYAADGTVGGITFSTAFDGKITASGTTASGGVNYFLARDMTLDPGTYTLSITGTHTGLTLIARDPVGAVNLGDIAPTQSSVTFTISATTSVRLYFNTGNSAVSVSISAYVQLESGSTATAYAPYSNICPISGWDEANVWRTGKNLLDLSFLEFDDSTYSHAYYPATTPQVTEYAKLMERFIGKTVVLSATVTGTQSAGTQPIGTIRLVNSGGDVFQIRPNTPATVPDMDYSNVSYLIIYGSANGASVSDIQLELGSTPTPYAPYTGNQFTIQLGQTVYGGTLDVTTGVLTVDRAMVDMGTLDYSKTSGTSAIGGSVFFVPVSNVGEGMATRDRYASNTMISSMFATAPSSVWWVSETPDLSMSVNTNTLFIADSRYADAATFKTAMSGVQLVYELATPITVPLTPTEIATLQGANNLWADTGDVDVKYTATGGEGGKLALLLRNRKELLIALRKGLTPAEAGLLNSTPLLGGFVRPGLSTDDEKEEDELL